MDQASFGNVLDKVTNPRVQSWDRVGVNKDGITAGENKKALELTHIATAKEIQTFRQGVSLSNNHILGDPTKSASFVESCDQG